jgi:hypothetical protein
MLNWTELAVPHLWRDLQGSIRDNILNRVRILIIWNSYRIFCIRGRFSTGYASFVDISG